MLVPGLKPLTPDLVKEKKKKEGFFWPQLDQKFPQNTVAF